MYNTLEKANKYGHLTGNMNAKNEQFTSQSGLCRSGWVVQIATLLVLLASLAVNLLVLRQNWSLKSRVFRLESMAQLETSSSKAQ